MRSNRSEFVLASASPRRSLLLAQLGLNFTVRPADIDETPEPAEPPDAYVRRLARQKAAAGARPGEVLLGADTIVLLDGEIVGKPRDAEHARSILQTLSGRTHKVVSGIAVVAPEDQWDAVVITDVSFGEISAELIRHYVAGGEPMDKAGAYGIQGYGAVFVTGINGSYSNVVGLPVRETVDLLQRAGIAALPPPA